MLYGKYKTLYDKLLNITGKDCMHHDPLYTLAWGTDASFYRLIPKLVIIARNEDVVSAVLRECNAENIPVTIRAAGTSLSGQAVSDSVLLVAGNDWKRYSINEDRSAISLQPGITGGKANALLARFGKKIGPDPASINAAMIGGIAANNASGMCCGTAQNSYKTVMGMKIILADGTVLDTRDPESRKNFSEKHHKLIASIGELAARVKENKTLADRIRHKYRMKNTTGYSLNSLVDYDDPFDIIEHLMIGSEGTLGFIAEITFRTVPEFKSKASSLMIFHDIESACKAVALLESSPVTAVELIDRAGLRSVQHEKGIPEYIALLGEKNCALLVETAASDPDELGKNIDAVTRSVMSIPSVTDIVFTQIPAEYEQLWKIRKGLFPSVGAMRKSGTTVIIEDVAFPVSSLAAATTDLQGILKKYGYDEAVIFGHALEGNLHFVFTQDFNSESEISRYSALMDEVAEMVVGKYDGSLKAEHGTGRNMAPYVEMEWGREAYELMKEIKAVFDPFNILNPGVILNDDKKVHLKNLKPIPAASEITDKCIECGFCEPSCVSAGLTLTPRQRIVAHREISSLLRSGREPHLAASLQKSYSYAGNNTCATDGLCAISCPVKIDTGKLIKKLREEKTGKNTSIAAWIASHMGFVTAAARISLNVIGFIRLITGARLMQALADGMRRISGNGIPAWNRYMPLGAGRTRGKRVRGGERERGREGEKVVYFPSCINRSMGVSHEQRGQRQLTDVMVNLMKKGGFEVIFPAYLDNLCCGMAFSSKGYTEAGNSKSAELESALQKASSNGLYPVVCDMSPCLFTMRENMKSGLKLYEPVEFILEHLVNRLDIQVLDETVTVFPVCSMKKMGLDGKLAELAQLCAARVHVSEANCCGFAGDRGFTYPELNRHGLKDLKSQIPVDTVKGYSTSRTCEIGLSQNTGLTYESIVFLADRASMPKNR